MPLKIKRFNGLQIEAEAKRFNQAFFITQRVGFFLMIVIILVALCGLFGSGFLSKAETTQGNLHVKYQKFIRHQAITFITIKVNEICHTEKIISISKNFFKTISIKSIHPTPAKEISLNEDIQYTFPCIDSNNIEVVLTVEPEQFGILQGNIVTQQNQVSIKQVIYP